MRRRRVVHLFTSVVAATASIAVLAACTSKPAPKEEATTRVSAAEGGLVQNPDGVMLRIPPKALTRDAEATISEIDDGVYDIHLSEALQGAVQVSLPVPDGEATDSYSFMAHEVNGEWTLENATLAGSALVANVNSLSPFKVLKCFKAKRGEPLIDCLLKAGIRQVSKAALTNLLGSVAQSVFDLCYNPGSAVDLILNDCKVGDPEGWQNHTTPPAPANTPTSVHQSPAQGATEEPPTPGTPPRQADPRISLKQGGAAPQGSWYSATLSGFTPGASVTLTCRDSVDPGGFWSQTFTIGGDGRATDSTLCYSADGPDHWVTGGGVESNHVTW